MGHPDLARQLLSLYENPRLQWLIRAKQWVGQLRPETYLDHNDLTNPPDCIVELGCGYGILSNYLSLILPETRIIGIDLNQERIKTAQETVGTRKNIEFICADATQLSDLRCDRVLMSDFLHHVTDRNLQQQLLSKTAEWLGETGILILKEVDPQANGFKTFNAQFFDWLFYQDWSAFMPQAWVKKTLNEAGFTQVQVEPGNPPSLIFPYVFYRAAKGARSHSAPETLKV